MGVLKVAIVVPSLPTGGGVSNVARFLYRNLQEQPGFDPQFVSLAVRRDDPVSVRLTDPKTWTRGVRKTEGTDHGNSYCHVGAFLTEFEFQRYQPRPILTRILKGYDLVQVVAGHPAWALVAKGLERPVALQVATLAHVERAMKKREGGGVVGLWRSLMTQITSWLGDRALRRVDAVFVENDWMHDYVQQTAPSTQSVFAPPGVDVETFVPSTTPFEERDYLLSVGRFGDPRKNPRLLFKAYARIQEELGEEAPLLFLAGRTGPSQEAWEVASQLGIREQVTFHQNVSHERLIELYQEAQLFLLSSDEEGLGLVILEAMACGVPVVSTDCGGPSTVIQEGETGRLVTKRDPDKLASAVADLLRDLSLLRRYGDNARKRVVDQFSEKAALQGFLDVYGDLLN
ncbi:glycosyltransferase involved in cell wall biosynthesis [Salinibacter ruber]|uniref:glycosyltransferase family 4 protein n=1 Tax=Salinibacter ruber TaxID=146919 RepID=UPI0021685D8B|nr:glycosyltransferase family 4 protein [Salinibacter ruber]MCS3861650.1 glycosyltransferase involved in cell wall biosynthesis [Salinibacter ruber]